MDTIRNRAILSLLSFTFLSIFSAFSQFFPVDSLEVVLAGYTRTDTAKVNMLNKLAFELHRSNPKKAISYAEQSQKMADQLNYLEGKAASLWTMGMSYHTKDKQLALSYYKQALHIAEQVNDQTGICNYLLAIGNAAQGLGDVVTSDRSFDRALQIASGLEDQSLYIKLLYSTANNLMRKGQYLEAVTKFQQVIDKATETSNQLMLSRAYLAMGSIFQRQGNSPQALEYKLSSLHISEQYNDSIGIFNVLIDIADIKSTLNNCQDALKNVDQAFQIAREMNDSSMIFICFTKTGSIYQQMKHPEALYYLQKALQMVQGKKINKTINLLCSIGSVYTGQKKFSEAEKNLKEALALAQKAELKYACGEALSELGILYYTQKQYTRAIECTNRALQVGSEIQYQELKKNSYKLLADIYVATGDYKGTYLNHANFKQLNDSMFNEKNVRKMTLLESTYKYDKEKQKYEMEKVNQQLKIKNQRYIIFSLIAVTLLVFILLYQLYLSNRLKKKALRLEIDQINSQLEYSQKEMVSATLQLVQNSESDAYCMKMLKSIENTDEEGEKNIRTLISYYKNKSVYSNWEEFETLFLKVNSDFYDKLNKSFPTLTLNERKLCVFLKLNMTNKDIAQITFQSDEALKKARMRLRKKLELDRDENLASFILNL
ncbi:tetratricopeptide repeat protein [Bacteroides sp.]|uniref:tetratricopeptide repeat protein n=1 Tax=Bacteroides sp. TaxID=29523 RepID=UPI00262A5612|nr:tetratricopeptide repeat protein [Bacteroides sp.]MDD3039139.1 tetratricopeptide repeat protein [Bacteroides sp.]